MAQTPFLLSTAASRCVFAGLLMGALVALGGCASPSTTKAPPTAVPDSFSTPGAQPTPDRWWTAFGSERLNTVVDSAAASNFPLRTAWQRFRAAQAVADRTPAALFPVIDGTAQGEASATQPPEGGTEQFQLDLNAAYEVDLWGRIQSRVAAEQFRTQATRADYQTAALSLSAEVVQTWVRWTEARSQRRLVNEQIAINRKVLNLLENRFRTGQIESVDVLRQRQLLESTREPRAAVESRIQMLEHQVAVLLGRPPQASVSAPPDTLPDLPPLPAPGVPTDLVQRRPDVRRAYNVLKAADRHLAAAISNQYPRLTLSASASEGNARSLFKDWAFGITLANQGCIDDVLPYLRRAYRQHADWARMVPRLPDAGLFKSTALAERLVEAMTEDQ